MNIVFNVVLKEADTEKLTFSVFTSFLQKLYLKENAVPLIRFISQSGPSGSYESTETEFIIGRSEDCQFQVLDKEVSRHHARVSLKEDRYIIENLGLNPVEINGKPVKKSYLENEDLIIFGETKFQVKIEGAPGKKKPVLHLVLEEAPGKYREIPIDRDRIVIGRSAEADIPLEDRTVSRKHCSIEVQDGECVAVSLSENNPLLVNKKAINRQRLYSGDRLLVGPYSLTFVSSRTQDIRAIEDDGTKIMSGPPQQDMGPRLVLESASGQTNMYPLDKDRVTIGRSDQSDIYLDDRSISREHCAIEKEADGYVAVNLSSSNVLKINNKDVSRQKLRSGDRLYVGSYILHYFTDEAEEKSPDDEFKTVMFSDTLRHEIGPRLILDTASGTARTYFLNKDRTTIGRSEEADIHLEDKTVSRQHCAIEKGEDEYIAVRLSPQSPVIINNEMISRQRLYSGDQIQLGSDVLSFVSDKPGDARSEKVLIKRRRLSPTIMAASTFLILIMGVYLAYLHYYVPWDLRNKLETADQEFSSKKYDSGREIIEDLLLQEISTEDTRKAKEMLADYTLKHVRGISESGNPKDARKLLTRYLKEYGGGKEASLLWYEIDRLRFDMGKELEKAGKFREALQEYSFIRADSFYYPDANKAIKRIWLAEQQQGSVEQQKEETLAKLLKEAENSYKAGQYLLPVKNSAYSIYQAVLTIDPENSTAMKGINDIKDYYRSSGIDFFEQNRWSLALDNFERYALIDPDNSDINNKIIICQEKLSEPKISAEKNAQKKDTIAKALEDERKRFAEQQKKQKEETLAKLLQQKEETLAKLLKKAENSFQAKQYLEPLNNNAYSFYQAVLAIDPENNLASERIYTIHSFYKNQGNQYFEEEKWEQALESFEDYTLMNPEDTEAREKIKICQKKLDSQKPGIASSSKKTDKLERALEDSGIESSRVLKYFNSKDEGE
ncbi:FHA domain-containing protein [Thermodesulfobacteriota bacterium]